MASSKTHIIKTIYIYLVSLIGLLMVVIPAASLIKLALTTWIFTKADIAEYGYEMPPRIYFPGKEKTGTGDGMNDVIEKLKSCQDSCGLTDEQKQAIAQWTEEFTQYQKRQAEMGPARRQRDAAQNIAFIVVGIPLFLYHWRLVRKEQREQKMEMGQT